MAEGAAESSGGVAISPVAAELERCLAELLAVEREVLELAYVRRSDALERVSEAVRRLGDLSSSEAVLERAAAELGMVGGFEQVVIGEVVDGRLAPLTIWAGSEPVAARAALSSVEPVMLAYPLVEHEVARSHHVQVVRSVVAAGARVPAAWTRALGWEAYAVAPLVVGGETIGLVHGVGGAGGVGDVGGLGGVSGGGSAAGEVVDRFAEELSGVVERAVLRHTLELHRAELRAATQWLGARLSRLDDAAAGRLPERADARLADTLTPRELDVLRLLARGQTNRAIANALVVREGTVKYHVKNILRKLGATSRADAVARYARAGGGGGRP